MSRDTRLVLTILGAWFIFALALGFAGTLRNASATVVAITVWFLTALTLLACWTTSGLHAWWRHVDLRWLVAFHATRFVGFYFLILCRQGKLSCDFAQPAGIGDICVAATALLLLAMRTHPTVRHIPQARRLYRSLLFLWNAAGLLDILFVVFAARRVGLMNWQAMAPLRELPLTLLPTFLVPLIITSHVLIFIRLYLRHKLESVRR
jgi:hypothetical protein